MWFYRRKRVKGMKKLTVVKKLVATEVPQEEVVEKKEKSKLPPDAYKEEFPPLVMEINETNKLILSVKRGGDLGLPQVDIRHYVTTERYTGFTKKAVVFPVEFLYEFIEKVQDLSDKCEEKGVE